MPPKLAKAATAGETGDGRKQPTAQEAYLFYTIIKNMKGKPEIDWAAVASDAGFKNAETAKVRYGQIKRKLGLDTWNLGRAKEPKDEDAGEGGMPQTPAAARTKKAAATPSTTGAGVKKRGSTGKRAANSGTGARSRKSKTQALIKMEEDIAQDMSHLDDDNDEDMLPPESPTKIKTPRNGIKTEFGAAAGHHNNQVNNDFATFPAVLPDAVLERQAILVHVNDDWVISPVSIEVHAQWLARLPAHIQTRFYTQATSGRSANLDNGNGNGGNGFLVDDDDNMDDHNNNDAAAVNAQLLGEHFLNASGSHTMPMTVAPAELSYLSAVGHGNMNGNGHHHHHQADIDLNSIPLHPGYMVQLEREAREQEDRDRAMLFDGHGGY